MRYRVTLNSKRLEELLDGADLLLNLKNLNTDEEINEIVLAIDDTIALQRLLSRLDAKPFRACKPSPDKPK